MSNRIRELRIHRELSQEALAERIGTTPQQISRLEKGERRLSQTWMERVARGLNVHPTELLPPNWFEPGRLPETEVQRIASETVSTRSQESETLSFEEERLRLLAAGLFEQARARGLLSQMTGSEFADDLIIGLRAFGRAAEDLRKRRPALPRNKTPL